MVPLHILEFSGGIEAVVKCHQCQSSLELNWLFCPFCSRKIEELDSQTPSIQRSSSERVISERYLLLANDYRSLTGHTLEGDVLKQFVSHPATSTLSMVEGKRRLTAGRKIRRSLGNGKFSIDLETWLDAVYEVEAEPSSSRVWISDGGTRYHSDIDCKGFNQGQEYARAKGKEVYKKQYVPIRDAAFVLALTACLVCKPPKYETS